MERTTWSAFKFWIKGLGVSSSDMSPSPAPISTCPPVYIDIYVYSSAFSADHFRSNLNLEIYGNYFNDVVHWICITKHEKWELSLGILCTARTQAVCAYVYLWWAESQIYSRRWARNVTLYFTTQLHFLILCSGLLGVGAVLTSPLSGILLASLPDATPSSSEEPNHYSPSPHHSLKPSWDHLTPGTFFFF